ncbi:MAG TPA: septum formation initiator family protein [Candidatus Latescibacteria bacterium]|jgi:cell division protein FtsB|nr:septum formation initiator family protein [Candidatus Handelsmanbacteria bacterium]HIL08375.1 septum formation initiator family protein [Candidatus Latescibacterota bacterium]
MAKTTKGKTVPLVSSARWRLLFLVVFVGLVIYIAAGDGLLFEVWKEEKELVILEAEVSRLDAQNDSLRKILRQLDGDMEYIEKIAREELGLIKPGEVVIPLAPEEGD